MSERWRVAVAYFLVCSIWGSTWLAIKIGLETVPPMLSSGLRFVVASAVLYPMIKFRGVTIHRTREARKIYLLIALTAFSVPYGLVYWGEQFIPSGLASVLFAVYPFGVALFSQLFLPSEKMTAWKTAGIAVGFLGILVIFSNDLYTSNKDALWGMGAVVLSAVLQAYSVILIKKFGHTVDPMVTTFVPILYSAFVLFAASIFFENYAHVHFSTGTILSIFYLGIFGTVVTFVSYFWLLKRVEAVILSLTSFITPVIAVILGVIILSEELSSRVLIGAAIVLAGILLANGNELRKFMLRVSA
ncbi:MAG: EamA family transporter [Bacteroidota bacterium]|nr:EamA family transporter [Bacteroidota bacterium]